MRKGLKKVSKGVYELNISFDITKHGHNFGIPRDYPINKVHALIRSQSVKNMINSSYALVMYGHGARDKSQGYIGTERNAKTGEEQEALGRVTNLSIKGNIISYSMLLVETPTNKTQSAIKLIENNIGGFSFVWDVPKGVFYGSDFVLSPNFNGNRVVMDSICDGGECKLDTSMKDVVLDAIGNHTELFDDALALLQMQDSSLDAYRLKNGIKNKIIPLKKQIEELNNMLENANTDIEVRDEKVKLSQDKLIQSQEEIAKLNDEVEKISKNAKRDKKRFKKAVKNAGLVIDDDFNITANKTAFGDLFISQAKEDFKDFDMLKKLDKEEKPFHIPNGILFGR